MEEINQFINKGKTEMTEHVAKLQKDLATIRTGRARAQLLENVRVDYYGTPTPIKQMALINVLDAKTLEIQPWDISSLNEIDKALQKADLGASPVNDGKVIRITLPSMTEDRRKLLAKNISKMSEDFKVAVRNTRRDVLEKVKKAQKAGEITEDDLKRYEADVQKSTDANIAQIDKLVSEKEAEIMKVWYFYCTERKIYPAPPSPRGFLNIKNHLLFEPSFPTLSLRPVNRICYDK